MTQCRILALAFLVLPLAACGGKSPAVEDVRPRTIVLDWVEFARSDGTPVLEFRVRRVHLSGSGWRVWASVRNVSRVSFTLKRPGGVAGTLGRGCNWTWFGLTVLSAPGVGTRISHAEKYSPPLPRVLAPKRTWSGVFGGPAFSTTDRTIGVTFGFFVPERRLPGLPESFGWLTEALTVDVEQITRAGPLIAAGLLARLLWWPRDAGPLERPPHGRVRVPGLAADQSRPPAGSLSCRTDPRLLGSGQQPRRATRP